MGTYDDIFRASVADPERFWLDAATLIDWTVPPSTALDASRRPFYRWFPDGELNEYVCGDCGASVGTRKVSAPPVVVAR